MRWRHLALLCLMLGSSAEAALRLDLDANGLDRPQREASQALLDDAMAHLPPVFIERLDRHVSVYWADDLPQNGYGRVTRPDALALNARLLPSLVDGSAARQATGRPHGTVRQELLATVLHELTHLYDRARLWPADTARRIRRCSERAASFGEVGLPDDCRGETTRRFTFSDDPRLLDLAGWPQRVGHRGEREAENHQRSRSPDLYELSNSREFIAVNMEYFLLDPQYRCRRPSLARYLTEQFDWSPDDVSRCAEGYAYLNAGRDFAKAPLGRLDPERVYQVDYLFAEANDAWASRWGHSMLRLVICAPGRPLGPDCRLDLDQHLVLSYRAFVDDLQISSWDGLTGNYPSRLFVLPLGQVIDEYTKTELRSLASVPLKLTREEIRHLVQRSAELHWNYDGDYYFLTNNCAVETLKLLRSGIDQPTLDAMDSILPNGLLALLAGHGLADESVLDDASEARRLGYRFDSYRDRYQAMFKVVRQHLPVEQASVKDWLEQPADTRRQWFARADLQASAALLLLEQAALRRQLQLAQDDLKQRYLDGQNEAVLAGAGKALRGILDGSGFLSRPAELLDRGYGLPQALEWQRLEAQSAARQKDLIRLSDELDSELRTLLTPERRAQLDASESNLAQLGDHLRQLHKAGNGLQLP